MKYLIYDNLEQAQQRCDKAFADMQCQDINTTAYAVPVKHISQELWAVPIDDNYLFLFTEKEISEAQELTPDWFPKIDLPI